MDKKELLAREIENVPDPLLDEVLDFVRFLKNRAINRALEISVASERALEKDWLRAEEEEAWRDL